jgi:hypothetical protein
MPRIACRLTGRPVIRSWRLPQTSVQGTSSVISWANAAWASSAAMRRIVAAGMPVCGPTTSGL